MCVCKCVGERGGGGGCSDSLLSRKGMRVPCSDSKLNKNKQQQKERERGRQTDRDRQTDSQTETETQRERESYAML